ncbi:MAG TPA: hypothetical protein VF476_01095, partial [Chitinophagaceae bacterium]
MMPEGKPNFEPIRYLPTITELCKEWSDGRKKMRLVLTMMVQNFAKSINVVRNLTEDQAIEIASFLLDESDDFRLEDYQMMFSLAKRGKLLKFRDRIDITVVSELIDAYWSLRRKEGERLREEMELTLQNKRSADREQKLLSSGKVIELPPDFFQKALKEMEDAAEQRRQQEFIDYIGRKAERKK